NHALLKNRAYAKPIVAAVNGDVGREQEFEASSDAIPVHRRNDGLRVRAILEQRVIDDARRLWVGGEIAAHVGARAERARARPGEDDAATGAVALEPVPERRELRHHGARHGIAARLV